MCSSTFHSNGVQDPIESNVGTDKDCYFNPFEIKVKYSRTARVRVIFFLSLGGRK